MGFALLLLLQVAPLPDSEISDLFDEILRRRRRIYGTGGWCGTRSGGLYADDYQRLLFIRAFPDKVERFARRIMEDPEAIPWDIVFVLGMIPRLSERTSREMEAHLVRLTSYHEAVVVEWAAERLSSPYGLKRHRKLFWTLCAEGWGAAFEALSIDVNPDTVRFLTELEVKERKDPRFDSLQISRQCRYTLEGIRILEAKDWKARLGDLLRPEQLDHRGVWAETAANRLDPTLIFPRCRRQAERARLHLEALFRTSADSKALKDSFAQGSVIKGIDFDFDLIDFSDLGGELTPIEKQRLTHRGFLGDAGKRLAEHLRSTSKYFP